MYLMLHVTLCDVIDIATAFFEIMYFALCQNFKLFLVDLHLKNVSNRTKIILVTPIALNTRKMSKILIINVVNI